MAFSQTKNFRLATHSPWTRDTLVRSLLGTTEMVLETPHLKKNLKKSYNLRKPVFYHHLTQVPSTQDSRYATTLVLASAQVINVSSASGFPNLDSEPSYTVQASITVTTVN
ncbi:hypothetical protein ElyMa_003559800 [Elysia marginata]|uniref:Uncharacterized protein n=1 Tax=Elysia marginata TaxID=1093978 RepID=A0AAV4ELQ7_9GAST|nr:hypothetical protein ElyMa_003559800 [Elysia marginata]